MGITGNLPHGVWRGRDSRDVVTRYRRLAVTEDLTDDEYTWAHDVWASHCRTTGGIGPHASVCRGVQRKARMEGHPQ